jgi:hypothetical protein
MVAFAAPATAAGAHECVPGQPTAASYTWDFKGEANTIFQDARVDAEQALNHADRLQSFANDAALSRETHAVELEALKQEVNNIGARLCRLETIRRVVAPWQQKEIDRIAATARLMADNTQDAISFIDAHPEDLWSPTYQKYTNNLYDEARSLAHSVGNAVAFANVSKEYRNLGHQLGIRASS